MSFWGIEVKPGKPFTHNFDNQRGRLHISQATLSIGSSTQKSVVQCNVGDKSPVLLCALLPDKNESCPLDLEFEEEEEVIFSVIGPRSVHLTGYYIPIVGCGHDDDSDSYGEDIAESETEQSEDYDTEEEYDDDFIDDDELEMFQSSPRRKSAVVIEEILDDEKPANGNGSRKRLKKKYQMSDSDDDDQKQIVVKDDTGSKVLESEDEDGFPISSITKNKAKESNKNVENGIGCGAGKKRKIHTGVQDSKAENKVSEQAKDSSVPSTETGHENDVKPKKKKKERSKKKNRGVGDDSQGDVQEANEANPEAAKADKMDQDPVDDEPKEKQPEYKSTEIADDVTDEGHSEKKKKKKKKKKSKAQESDENAKKDDVEKKELTVENKDKEKVKPSKVRTFGNGLVIEDVKMGKPDGKRASPGNTVTVKYIGKLKSNGNIFDSNVIGKPFKFRLGVGQVIPGWDVGVNGMRVGDKRRLTIPPSMGYGDKGAPPKIPQKAWLVFDIELVDVRA
ncbi:Peptidyl-prolyl cis-trans isomerase [Macleaya cordata]|uniref:peptidylprolyl isomerase n=1 Tax=Macleaya cordata TaxID=56857 RepID=A0A200QB46_MACCD|nr:Peptidyl-prolyl cis-trans isomerase [Macleaya cordata]